MSKKHNQKVQAPVAAGLGAALQEQAFQPKGALIPTLTEYATIEADMIDSATRTRSEHWCKVLKDYQHSAPELTKYPQEVRHAYARKLGIDMGKIRAEWSASDRKLYDTFCANQVSPLQLMVSLALGTKDVKGVGCNAVIELLQSSGTLPRKVSTARMLLGKPVKTRGAKATTPESAKVAAQVSAGTMSEVGTDGKQQWDLTDLKRKTPVEVAIQLIASPSTKEVDCITILGTIKAKLAQSSDPVAKLLSIRIGEAVKEYDSKNKDDTGDEDDNEGELQEAAA